jgi:ureidoacrylate peracid hydrolase
MEVAVWAIDPSKCALIVVDMQNDFVLEGYPMEVPNARKAIPHIQRLIAACRKLDIPIIYTQHTLLDGAANSPLEAAYNPKLFEVGMRKGTFGVQVIDDLKPESHDTIIEKYRYNAFHNTLLEPTLQTIRGLNQIDTVIITGTLTEVCCDSTARGAYMRDYKVAFVDDATGGLSETAEQATFNAMRMFFGRVMNTDTALAELSA